MPASDRPPVALLLWSALCCVACDQSSQVASHYAKSQLIGAALGGPMIVTATDDPLLANTSVIVPPGALAQDTLLTVAAGIPVPLPTNGQPAGPVADFGPNGTVFASPATVTLPYVLPSGTSTSDLEVVAVEDDGRQWTVPTASLVLDTDAMTVSFAVSGFTRFGCVAIQGAQFHFTPVPAAQLLNLDYGLDVAQGIDERESGPAVVGATSADVWNPIGVLFSLADAGDFLSGPFAWADGTPSQVTAETLNLPAVWDVGFPIPDPMLTSFSYSLSGSQALLDLYGLPSGTYDLYLYGLGGAGENSGYAVSSFAPDGTLLTSLPPLFTTAGTILATWQEGNQYVVQRNVCVETDDGGALQIAVANGVQGTGNAGLVINGLQLVQTSAGSCAP